MALAVWTAYIWNPFDSLYVPPYVCSCNQQSFPNKFCFMDNCVFSCLPFYLLGFIRGFKLMRRVCPVIKWEDETLMTSGLCRVGIENVKVIPCPANRVFVRLLPMGDGTGNNIAQDRSLCSLLS